ncbi:TerC family protein [Leptospira licerasiae]|uniref:Integral membrane protein TerC family protein n=1 Tax=Leptospira licerasiae str. MMD4847 TaxID=1049971 RepID=A0ABP2RA20_9LEPT|nr:TerC family protein [Leptospira licerasiae]EIE00902.1 integral membrane protein TerC family protein [Leptospira licerasiae serovar Varillal str. VAR 010]EJZ41367.1 integral membrane protein TerC family protein [Leptospira licerasiae str. MMD4847]TGM89343.1 TerC family protein [Leptospira licerasiae]
MDLHLVDIIISLLTLTAMEIVLGIDNIVFLSIVVGKLPKEQQASGRTIGLVAALGFRIGLLLTVSWLASLTNGLFRVGDFTVTGRDLIMLGGGLFLIAKSTSEIHHKMEEGETELDTGSSPSFFNVIVQIIILDIIFSVDSIITAVGLSGNLMVMVLAVVISLLIMLIFSGKVSDFINEHPTMKILALSFLIMIGVMLFADGLHFHIPKGYIYFSMAFSLLVEFINMRVRKANQSP